MPKNLQKAGKSDPLPTPTPPQRHHHSTTITTKTYQNTMRIMRTWLEAHVCVCVYMLVREGNVCSESVRVLDGKLRHLRKQPQNAMKLREHCSMLLECPLLYLCFERIRMRVCFVRRAYFSQPRYPFFSRSWLTRAYNIEGKPCADARWQA